MPLLSTYIREVVKPQDYYTEVLPSIRWPEGENSSEPRVKCCFHQDKRTPSLSINPISGAWFCHGCEKGGKSIISFHSEYSQCSFAEASTALFEKYIHPLIDERTVRRWERQLKNTPSAMRYLVRTRNISPEIISRFKIGWNGDRITIPIYNEFDLCINAKLYDPRSSKKDSIPKMLNYTKKGENRHYGRPAMLFPLAAIQDAKRIIICEGEWDALVLISLGIPAITTTAGSKSWPTQYNGLFRGREVIIAYDNDVAGRTHDKIVFRHLISLAQIIRRLRIPKKFGKDISDWVHNKRLMKNPKIWEREFAKAKVLIENPIEELIKDKIERVSLPEASQAKWFNKPIEVDALITGKDTAPYIIPRVCRITCTKSCEGCPIPESENEFREVKVDPTQPLVLNMIDTTKQSLRRTILSLAGIPNKTGCSAKIQEVEMVNLEQILLIPTLDSQSAQYVMRTSYFVGHGLKTNRSYRFSGITVPHPQDQHATHLFVGANPVQTEIETFELNKKLRKDLQVFRPRNLKPMAHLYSIAEWQSRHITKIHERPDLHIAVDLVFHSARSFTFNKEFIHRGMLDMLVIGDTRCGKGYVAEGLVRYYGLGEVASGENCSFAGLIGGLQQVGRRWIVTWGIIPLNHDRIVIIDETSALTEHEIGHMSRVRSEGVAEISKIIRESTQANTRLIWLSNPRSGRPMMSYNSGVQAIKELIGNNEDISRFDFAISVATNEVPSEIINAPADYKLDDVDLFPRELCRNLILWVWSRKPDQVKFTGGATRTILREAKRFGRDYSSSIPLVQAENIRIKIAKVSVAVAARTFSTDDECDNIIVAPHHVMVACNFLRELYSKASMAYDLYSHTAAATQDIKKVEEVDKTLLAMGKNRRDVISGLLEIQEITPENLSDYTGDVTSAKMLIGELVRLRCLARIPKQRWYLKNPAFSSLLKERMKGG